MGGNERTDGMDGMDGWMEGGREGGRDGWMDGWMTEISCILYQTLDSRDPSDIRPPNQSLMSF